MKPETLKAANDVAESLSNLAAELSEEPDMRTYERMASGDMDKWRMLADMWAGKYGGDE